MIRSLGLHPRTSLLLVLLIVVGLVAYWPGLSGGFLFDDWVNLPALGRYGPIHDGASLARYLTSGIADPTGRPVSLLSFLLDAQDWPADPYPFKRTNLLLHLVNGALLYSVLSALGRCAGLERETTTRSALLAASIWTLHPFWSSTVLYVVQRHAMLATFFVLAGIRAWIAGQQAFGHGRTRWAWTLSIIAVPILGLMAGLSKANGFLLPMLLAALGATVLRIDRLPRDAQAHARQAQTWLVTLPALLTVPALAFIALNHIAAFPQRPWSIGERLLSQPRALFDYLQHLLVPRLDATGVFADAFEVSRGLLTPWTTLIAVIALIALAGLAWSSRRSWPLTSAAVLVFLSGHAMESSVVPLELYFEHRNYLPATLLFWPLAVWLCRPGQYMRLRLVAGLGFVILCTTMTWAQARLWGDPALLAQAWGHQLPNSPRAQTYAALSDLAAGHSQRAITRLQPLAHRDPSQPQYAAGLLDAHCAAGYVPRSVISAGRRTFEIAGLRSDSVYHWVISSFLDRDAWCHGLPKDERILLATSVTTGITDADDIETRARQARILALIALENGDCRRAEKWFEQRLNLQRRPEFAHDQIALLASSCGARSGLAHLDHYLAAAAVGDYPMNSPALRLRDSLMTRQGYWTDEWKRLRKVLETDISKNLPASQS